MRLPSQLIVGIALVSSMGSAAALAQTSKAPALKPGVTQEAVAHVALCHNAAERETYLLKAGDPARLKANARAQYWYDILGQMAADDDSKITLITNATIELASRLVESGDRSDKGILAVTADVLSDCVEQTNTGGAHGDG